MLARPGLRVGSLAAVMLFGLIVAANDGSRVGAALERARERLDRFLPNLGVVVPGDCVLIREDRIDGSNRIRTRLAKACY